MYKVFGDMPFEEAINRLADCFDEPFLYSNEPMLDRQAWRQTLFLAELGNHLVELREQGPDALEAWVMGMVEQDRREAYSFRRKAKD